MIGHSVHRINIHVPQRGKTMKDKFERNNKHVCT